MIRKRFLCLILLLVMICSGRALSDDFLPDLDDVYGVEVPSFTDIIQKYPDSSVETDKGTEYVYTDVADEHYYAYGEALKTAGWEVADYSISQKTIDVTLTFKGKQFSFNYDSTNATMTVFYPEGVHDEPRMTPTPMPTPAPTETPKLVNWSENAGYSIDLGEQNEFECFKGQKLKLKAVIKSLDGAKHNKVKVTWKTSDKSVATVNNKGQVTCIAEGDATITCQSKKNNDIYSLVFIHVKPLVEVGETFAFGHYEQDNNKENGREAIEWIVLEYDEKNQKALLLSKYGLDVQRYGNHGYIAWKDCSLRTWLNDGFLKTAFTRKEQEAILVTNVNNSASQGYKGRKNGSGGKNTKDRVFLLSYAEAKKYLGVDSADKNAEAYVTPTVYAITQGALTGNLGKGWWWLRSPSRNCDNGVCVNSSGVVYEVSVYDDMYVVRPALWLNLSLMSSDLKPNLLQ